MSVATQLKYKVKDIALADWGQGNYPLLRVKCPVEAYAKSMAKSNR